MITKALTESHVLLKIFLLLILSSMNITIPSIDIISID
ncbi:Alanine racemase [Rickettsia prowazekii str. Breinl]|nr:Alanine racemase [Rickettsia prowazekii str. Breinl]